MRWAPKKNAARTSIFSGPCHQPRKSFKKELGRDGETPKNGISSDSRLAHTAAATEATQRRGNGSLMRVSPSVGRPVAVDETVQPGSSTGRLGLRPYCQLPGTMPVAIVVADSPSSGRFRHPPSHAPPVTQWLRARSE